MFADPFSNLMLVILLFFAGLLIMFIFMMRSIEASWRNQEDTRKQVLSKLGELERKISELNYAVYELKVPEALPAAPVVAAAVAPVASATLADPVTPVVLTTPVTPNKTVSPEHPRPVQTAQMAPVAQMTAAPEPAYHAQAIAASVEVPPVQAEPVQPVQPIQPVQPRQPELVSKTVDGELHINHSCEELNECLPDLLAGLTEETAAERIIDPAAGSFVGERRVIRRLAKK